MGLKFDATVNAGHILTAAAMVGSVFLAYSNIKRDQAVLEVRITGIVETVATLADTVATMRGQETRISVLETVVRGLPEKLDAINRTLGRIESGGDFR